MKNPTSYPIVEESPASGRKETGTMLKPSPMLGMGEAITRLVDHRRKTATISIEKTRDDRGIESQTDLQVSHYIDRQQKSPK